MAYDVVVNGVGVATIDILPLGVFDYSLWEHMRHEVGTVGIEVVNTEQAAAWDGHEGDVWTEQADRYDRASRRIWQRFVDRTAHRPRRSCAGRRVRHRRPDAGRRTLGLRG